MLESLDSEENGLRNSAGYMHEECVQCMRVCVCVIHAQMLKNKKKNTFIMALKITSITERAINDINFSII